MHQTMRHKTHGLACVLRLEMDPSRLEVIRVALWSFCVCMQGGKWALQRAEWTLARSQSAKANFHTFVSPTRKHVYTCRVLILNAVASACHAFSSCKLVERNSDMRISKIPSAMCFRVGVRTS
jgi:hypothetical protein